MATKTEFSEFLQKAERRAFKHALFAVKDEQDALDIVQDSMLKLVSNYADKSLDELPPLFQRILQNSIYDHFRHQRVLSFVMQPISAFVFNKKQNKNEETEQDLLDIIPAPGDYGYGKNPNKALEQSQLINIIEKSLENLPARQREAFLLRYWEGMDVNETSRIMGCSEGSVKTHCSRAINTLAGILQEKGVEL